MTCSRSIPGAVQRQSTALHEPVTEAPFHQRIGGVLLGQSLRVLRMNEARSSHLQSRGLQLRGMLEAKHSRGPINNPTSRSMHPSRHSRPGNSTDSKVNLAQC